MIDVNFGQKAKGIEGSYILLSSGGALFLEGHSLLAWRVNLSKYIRHIDNGGEEWADSNWK